jgi:MFS family permease
MRQELMISRDFASLVMMITALAYSVASLIAGRFVNMFGRKIITSVSLVIASVSMVIFYMSNSLWIALIFLVVLAWFIGMSVSAGQSLNLEQVPEFRGTMMSLATAFGGIGSTLGAGVGGYVLLVSNWGTLGLVFGLMGIFGAIIVYLFAIDPIKGN